MCIYFGVVFVCLNYGLNEDERHITGVENCHLTIYEPQSRFRETDEDEAPLDFYGYVCPCAGEASQIVPQEIFYGWCDNCLDAMTGYDFEPVHWEIRQLKHGGVFYQHLKREDGGHEVLSREEAMMNNREGWYWFAVNHCLRAYHGAWMRGSGCD